MVLVHWFSQSVTPFVVSLHPFDFLMLFHLFTSVSFMSCKSCDTISYICLSPALYPALPHVAPARVKGRRETETEKATET